MQVSYSKVDSYWTCPFLYKLRYIDKLKTKPDTNPASALYEGTSLHEAIEKRSIDEGLNSYKSNYIELGPEHEFEMYKLERAMKKALDQIKIEGEYERKLAYNDFIGFIDMLVPVDEGVFDLYDFKYSNSVENYKKSGQVHVYKYYFEKMTGQQIRNMYYIMIPKCPEKYDESKLDELKQKVNNFYNTHNVTFESIEFDKQKVNNFFARKTLMEKEKLFEKRYSFKCNWCEYQKYCSSKGEDTSELLENVKTEEVNLWE